MRRFAGIFVVLSTAWLAACDHPTPAAPDDSLRASVGGVPALVPFSLREHFQPAPDAVVVPCTPAPLGPPNRYLAHGTALHLGQTTSVYVFDTCALHLPPGTGWVAQGHSVTTGANGDELWWTFTTRYFPTGELREEIVISGGTGRFVGVSGWAESQGRIDPATVTGYTEARGMMSAPKR